MTESREADSAEQPDLKRRRLDAETTPLQGYRELLEAEVKSTRTRWPDFLAAHKRDRRFLSYGRSDRERERAFKDWLVELGERKRKAQLQAEDDFVALLDSSVSEDARAEHARAVDGVGSSGETRKAALQAAWATVKKLPGLDKDPRYEAVGSSTRRAELFADWLISRPSKKQAAPPSKLPGKGLSREEADVSSKGARPVENVPDAAGQRRRDKARDAELALRAREEQVRQQREQAESRQRRVLSQATHTEDVLAFKQMLIDYVRDPLTSFPHLAGTLGRSDRRFSAPTLREREKADLLWEHCRSLLARRRNALRSIFDKVAPSLATEKEVALPLVREEDEWERAELSRLVWGEREQKELESVRSGRVRESEWQGLRTLDREWADWHAERLDKAEREFKEMLSENAFVNFWVGLKHHKQTHDPNAPPAEDLDSDDEDAVGMLEMARQIDLGEIDAVLQGDARYRAFQHKPELRERWIREHMERLAGPKQTVHRTGL
ncbi:hypothetical protein V8E36_005950 [Tilletia maclaganii]